MIGQVLKDTYRLYERVGVGGFATIYLGRNLKTNQVVAVKVLRQEYTEEPRFVERFRREAEMASQLQHPSIVEILDYGVENGAHFVVMEYLEGKNLAEIIQEQGSLSKDEAVAITRQVAQALQAAHQAGIVHRDLKPANLMVLPPPREGAAHVYLGTSSWIGVTLDRPRSVGRAGIASVPSAARATSLLIAESETAGACRDWFAEHVGDLDDDLIAGAPPGSDGLLFLPWLFGERSPVETASS